MGFSEARLHDILVSGPSLIKQAVENKEHPLDVVREALSNSCASEVGAKKVVITLFKHPEYGATFTFFDDGIGMDWTRGREGLEQGRLDRFLNLGFSGSAGISADEFGWKGLGAKLMYWCRQMEIETVSRKDRKRYKVTVLDPLGALQGSNPRLPEPLIAEFPVNSEQPSFTKITIFGYDSGSWHREYDLDKLKVYLFHRTLVGCTREDRATKLPEIVLKHPEMSKGEERVVPGYRFLKPAGGSWRTVVIDPTSIREPADDGKETIVVTLKGGFTLDTGNTGTEFSLTPGNKNVGINVSVLTIPYFSLDFSEFRGDFRPAAKLCNFVVECDQLNLNMARSWYVADSKSRAFESAVRKAITKVRDLATYKQWVENEDRLRREELSESLNQRKQRLQDSSQKWVYLEGSLIHVEPRNEKDTLAVLWKLEALQKLPFYHFRSLEHASLEGIDLICDYQETKESQKRIFESVEVEYRLQSYPDHEHVPSQTGLIFCWEAKPMQNLEKVTEYKSLWKLPGAVVPVYVVSKFPGIETKTKG